MFLKTGPNQSKAVKNSHTRPKKLQKYRQKRPKMATKLPTKANNSQKQLKRSNTVKNVQNSQTCQNNQKRPNMAKTTKNGQN